MLVCKHLTISFSDVISGLVSKTLGERQNRKQSMIVMKSGYSLVPTNNCYVSNNLLIKSMRDRQTSRIFSDF